MSSNDDFEAKIVETLLENGKNKHKLYCERCSSVILLPQKADMAKKEVK